MKKSLLQYFFTIVDDNPLGIALQALAIGIVEDVALGIPGELGRRHLVGRAVAVVEHHGQVGIPFGIPVALDGIRHVLGQLEERLVVGQPPLVAVDFEAVVIQAIVDDSATRLVILLRGGNEAVIVCPARHQVAGLSGAGNRHGLFHEPLAGSPLRVVVLADAVVVGISGCALQHHAHILVHILKTLHVGLQT